MLSRHENVGKKIFGMTSGQKPSNFSLVLYSFGRGFILLVIYAGSVFSGVHTEWNCAIEWRSCARLAHAVPLCLVAEAWLPRKVLLAPLGQWL